MNVRHLNIFRDILFITAKIGKGKRQKAKGKRIF
jgi:hypothetical protein